MEKTAAGNYFQHQGRATVCITLHLEILHWPFKFDGIYGVDAGPKFRFWFFLPFCPLFHLKQPCVDDVSRIVPHDQIPDRAPWLCHFACDWCENVKLKKQRKKNIARARSLMRMRVQVLRRDLRTNSPRLVTQCCALITFYSRRVELLRRPLTRSESKRTACRINYLSVVQLPRLSPDSRVNQFFLRPPATDYWSNVKVISDVRMNILITLRVTKRRCDRNRDRTRLLR